MRPRILLVVLCVCVGFLQAEVRMAGGLVSMEGMVAGSARWYESRYGGFSEGNFDLLLRSASIGMTVGATEWLEFRGYFDLANMHALDLYARAGWSNGLSLTAGRFVVPLSHESGVLEFERRLADYSLLSRFWKPSGARDIGVVVSYRREWLDIWGSVVNGNGWWPTSDENRQKDFALRAAFRPGFAGGIGFGLRGYYGYNRVNDQDLLHRQFGGELFWKDSGVELTAEVQHAVVPGTDARYYKRNSGYIQGTCRLARVLEPTLRLELELQAEDRYEAGATAALAFVVREERLRAVLSYDYVKKDSKLYPSVKGDKHEVMLELRANL